MRQMSSTAEEFHRALVQAFGPAVTVDASGILLAVEGVQLHFALKREEIRQIGALQLESLRVEISVRSGSAAAAEKLLASIDRATQRGGG